MVRPRSREDRGTAYQWFQVLMGSKKRALGEILQNGDDEVEQDRIAGEEVAGTITEAEKARIMLDLRPR
jgi:hypothetical protein